MFVMPSEARCATHHLSLRSHQNSPPHTLTLPPQPSAPNYQRYSPCARPKRKSLPFRVITPSLSVHFHLLFARATFSNCARTKFELCPSSPSLIPADARKKKSIVRKNTLEQTRNRWCVACLVHLRRYLNSESRPCPPPPMSSSPP